VQVSENEKAPKGTDMDSKYTFLDELKEKAAHVIELIDTDYKHPGLLIAKYRLRNLDDNCLLMVFESFVDSYGGDAIADENSQNWTKIRLWMAIDNEDGHCLDLDVDEFGLITGWEKIRTFCEKLIAGRNAEQLEGMILHICVFAMTPMPRVKEWVKHLK
jgi:hypothetical protein